MTNFTLSGLWSVSFFFFTMPIVRDYDHTLSWFHCTLIVAFGMAICAIVLYFVVKGVKKLTHFTPKVWITRANSVGERVITMGFLVLLVSFLVSGVWTMLQMIRPWWPQHLPSWLSWLRSTSLLMTNPIAIKVDVVFSSIMLFSILIIVLSLTLLDLSLETEHNTSVVVFEDK